MKKIISVCLMVLMCIGITACSNKEKSTNAENTVSKEEKKANEDGKASQNKIHQQGEEVFIVDDSGKKMYSLKINSVKAVEGSELKKYLTEANQKQIVEVDYTYNNIAKDDEKKLEIRGFDLQVADSKGAVAQCSDMYLKQRPQEITVGTNCTAQAYYGLTNQSDKVKVIFSSSMYKKNGAITFEIPVK